MYFGSVRFFKHLIIFIIIAVILSLSLGLVSANNRCDELRRDSARYQEALQAMGYVLPEKSDGSGGLQNHTSPPVEGPSFTYQTLYPELYVTPAVSYAKTPANTVYLTFDGGISSNTSAILDVLKEKEVKATFFVVGSYCVGCEDVLKRIVDEGHTLGMRGYSNDSEKIYKTVESFLADFDKCFNIFVEETGVTPTVFRFPGGSINSYNSGIYQQLIAETTRRGFTFYDWNILGQDVYNSSSPMLTNVISGCKTFSGGTVLLHDQSTDAMELRALIDELQNSGYTLAKITSSVQPVVFSYPSPTKPAAKDAIK